MEGLWKFADFHILKGNPSIFSELQAALDLLQKAVAVCRVK